MVEEQSLNKTSLNILVTIVISVQVVIVFLKCIKNLTRNNYTEGF